MRKREEGRGEEGGGVGGKKGNLGENLVTRAPSEVYSTDVERMYNFGIFFRLLCCSLLLFELQSRYASLPGEEMLASL